MIVPICWDDFLNQDHKSTNVDAVLTLAWSDA